LREHDALVDPLPLTVPDTWLRVGCSGLAFCELADAEADVAERPDGESQHSLSVGLRSAVLAGCGGQVVGPGHLAGQF
jgi:hypothetical protein